MVTLYTTPTCGTCKVAERQLDAADILFEKVDLTEHPDTLAELKERLNVTTLQLPIIGYQGELLTIVDLRGIIEDAG
ncbi:NrdH-like glutaredoxin [Microbacterium phage Arroyo]|uniref:NrdH-like glutaredoxin n=1 Tax=Microbacterium phage Arroyo TaxID=2591213 RepID=UPI0011657E39|nr:NrdH-like glutaredoxin [Microbacterium phage Arroyo]YP_010753048.1 NrdH-like glutaredoxin [Microbacterium phage Albright]YP_010753946.1 thioredoxin [Microbacterium phage CroZenni]YP_010754086.1 thioredoxin [Microbacterium phage AnnaLie]QUE25515.1 NrdH-like glutaredoxin [Microbacterium phage BelmontSKP]QDH93453.1 NrdH-like glutaredoxin [Microbacterium phage Arroyo]QOC59486.1 thioredoxin [Microbacterium phage AnnaLie]QTF82209.1 NrdH-like glutaredoxin [Microbacterium phage Albright]QWY79859